MKKVLFFIMALFVTNVAMADSYFYIDNIDFLDYQKIITVPVKAHFDGRVSGFQLEVSYPEGLTPTAVTASTGMNISYLDANGESRTASVDLRHKADYSLIMTATTEGGWQDDGSGTLEEYGVI